MSTAAPNVLIMQSGGPTNVINASLSGMVDEAICSGGFGRVYGAYRGIEGLLEDKVNDLTDLLPSYWARVSRTPGALLGSTRRKLTPDDVPGILGLLCKYKIGYWFTIGGNDSALTGHTIFEEAVRAGYDLTVVNVPKTVDNDLIMTDHCPGYGSAARYVALATMCSAWDSETLNASSPVTIIEVMGRDAGWLSAASGIARREERDAPHLICVPEKPLIEDWFIARMEEAYTRFGFAVAVVSENTRGPDGVLGEQTEPYFVDDFGHAYYDGPARYLSGLVAGRLGVPSRFEKPGKAQRSFVPTTSNSDRREAEMAGRAAVRAALGGDTDVMVTLVRGDGPRYECGTGLVPLAQVAGQVRTLPERYLDATAGAVTPEFIRYLRPLVGPLPRFARLS
ncbi:diphosphate--fructose-6-phosphate 1-phosphotransferase [Dehalococcoidia bacterium]|nr:diphosphate--fructose-6-phosphate 1-phosphotransferase [Dehalococcoidia bacterium]